MLWSFHIFIVVNFNFNRVMFYLIVTYNIILKVMKMSDHYLLSLRGA